MSTSPAQTQTPDLDPSGGKPLRPPLTLQRTRLLAILAIIVALVPVGMWQTGMSPLALVQSLGDLANLAGRMWPPSFAEWPRYVDALLVTVYMVLAGTALAIAISIPVSILAARNTTTGRIAYSVSRAVIVFTRSVPDIVFALIFVRVVGIGPIAGVLAIAINSIGMVGKFYSDAVEEVDPGPLEALQAAGARRLQVFTSGVLPQVLTSWIALALYRVDINVRSAVILGYVGAGGIGLELQRVQGQLAYSRVLTIVLIILALVIIVEQLSGAIRRTLLGEADDGENPFKLRNRLRRRRAQADATQRSSQPSVGAAQLNSTGRIREPWTRVRRKKWAFALLGVVLVLVSFAQLEVSLARYIASIENLLVLLALMVPPDFLTNIDRTITQLVETFWIAITATGLGVLLSIPFAVLGARNVSPSPAIYRLSRLVMVGVRGIPELILAVLFVVAVGLGPFAGVMALTIGAIGLTGKLMADALESLPLGRVQEGLASTGAGWLQRTVSGVIPQAMPSMVGVGLYTFDVYIRAATILGVVGAGGIGNMLDSTIGQRQWDRMAAVIIIIFVAIYAVERFSGWIRKQLI